MGSSDVFPTTVITIEIYRNKTIRFSFTFELHSQRTLLSPTQVDHPDFPIDK